MKQNIDARPTIEETILPSRDITRLDYNGYLFTLYPETFDMAKSRDALIEDIRRSTPKDEPLEVTHHTILRAYDEKCERIFRNKPPHIQEREMIALKKKIDARRVPNGGKPLPQWIRFVENGADPNDPEALTWDAANCRAVRVNKTIQARLDAGVGGILRDVKENEIDDGIDYELELAKIAEEDAKYLARVKTENTTAKWSF